MKKGKTILPTLLAAALLTSGGVLGIDAASINGKDVGNTVTNDAVAQAGSSKLVIGGGKDMSIETNDSIGNIIQRYQAAKKDGKKDVDALRIALSPSDTGTPLVGVVGGDMQIDSSTKKLLNNSSLKGQLDKVLPGAVDKLLKADTAGGDNVTKEGSYKVTVGANGSSPVIAGFIGGDAALNTGANSKVLVVIPYTDQQDTSIIRKGSVTGEISGGNILGGMGGSAAVAVGNLNASVSGGLLNLNLGSADKATTASTKIDGGVDYTINGKANVGVWANGGGALAAGGNATSTITGNSKLTIETDAAKDNKIDGVVGVVAGGGTAISTLGGTATSEVKGTTDITVNSGLTGLVAGGGAAVSLDATAVWNNTIGKDKPSIGNDNGVSDKTIKDIVTITANKAIEGGTAKAKTGDTHISLNGNSTALITAGGGVAGAWHSYTNRDETDQNKDNNGQPGGTATAKAESGDVTIDVNLDTKGGAEAVTGVKAAVSAIKNVVNGLKGDDGKVHIGNIGLDTLNTLGGAASGLSGKGMAVGTLGGGVAVSVSDGGTTTSSTVQDVTINLNKGYAVGTFGGGLSANVYNKSTASAYDYTDGEGNAKKGQMKSETSAEKVTINVKTNGDNDKAIGVFAGGVAVSSEYGWKHDENLPKASDSLSVSKVNGDASIIVEGKADGVFGGGLAVGNSNVTDSGADALASVGGTSSITVNGGTVEHLNLEPIMKATQNTNDNEWPQWNMLGYNASGTMVNLKGITDHTAIAGGGMALGMSAKAENNEVNIAVNSGTVNGDILGGGIAVDQLNKGDKADNGAQVGKSTITLSGSKVEGSVYAGGAINKTGIVQKIDQDNVHRGYTGTASSTVDTSSVTLSGTEVTGEISGQGYEVKTVYDGEKYNPYFGDGEIKYEKTGYTSVTGDSTLTLSGDNTLSALNGDGYASTAKIHDFKTVNVEAGTTTLTGDFSTADKALIKGGTVKVEDGAKLDVHQLASGVEQHIVSGANTGSTFWDRKDLVYDRFSGYAYGQSGDGTGYVVTYTANKDMTDPQKDAAADEMTNDMAAGPLRPVILDGIDKGWIPENGLTPGGVTYFKDWYANKDVPGMNALYGRAALLGEDAAVTGNTLSLAREMAEAGAERFSFKSDDEKGVAAPEGGLWAKYLHHKYTADGLSSVFGDIRGDSTYDGAVIGVDFKKEGKFQTGAAFHYGSGDGSGAISQNDFDAYGFTLFGSMKDEAAGTNLLADIGYTKTSNDITGHVNGKTLTADRDVTAWTVGLRGEKEYVSGKTQFVPYAGLRYVSLNPSAYDSYYGGQKLFHNDADNQSLWLLPVGVSFKTDIAAKNGWTFAPKAELAYIWAFGDKDTDVDVSISGDASAPLSYTVADDSSWLASLGIEAQKDVWTFGAGYAYQKGDDSKSEKWYVNAAYAF